MLSVYLKVSNMLLLSGVLTTLLEVSSYICSTQTERGGEWEARRCAASNVLLLKLAGLITDWWASEQKESDRNGERRKRPAQWEVFERSSVDLEFFSPSSNSSDKLYRSLLLPLCLFVFFFSFSHYLWNVSFLQTFCECNVIVSCGKGHRKGITLSLQICLRCHFRGIWPPLWCPLASPQWTCADAVSIPHKQEHKTLVFGQGVFFFLTMFWLGILNLEPAPGILTFANHYLVVSD